MSYQPSFKEKFIYKVIKVKEWIRKNPKMTITIVLSTITVIVLFALIL